MRILNHPKPATLIIHGRSLDSNEKSIELGAMFNDTSGMIQTSLPLKTSMLSDLHFSMADVDKPSLSCKRVLSLVLS
jgi:hypothetical protein